MKTLAGRQKQLYTRANSGASPAQNMLEHLMDFEPPEAALDDVIPVDKASTGEIVAAQLSTAQWLEQIGAPLKTDVDKQAAEAQAKDAFKALVADAPVAQQREKVLTLQTPMAVRHLTGMLTAYDWEFVNQAKQLRGYAVAQILEETKHPDAKIRLRALEMLGKVTEVALFTDRIEVKKTDLGDADLDAKIKEKLNRFMGVTDVTVTDIPNETA